MSDVKTSISLSKEVLDWIDKQIENKRFASRSHAVDYCVNEIIKKDKEYLHYD